MPVYYADLDVLVSVSEMKLRKITTLTELRAPPEGRLLKREIKLPAMASRRRILPLKSELYEVRTSFVRDM